MRPGLAVCAALLVAAPLARALDWPGSADAVDAAFERARGPEGRVAALDVLRDASAVEAAPVLERALASAEAPVRAAAARVVGDVGVVSLSDRVRAASADADAEVREAALGALAALGDPADALVLARALSDRSAEVRVAAITGLAQLGTPDAVVAVTGALQDRSRDVVVAALGALGDLGQPGTIYAVLDRLSDPSAEVALAAIATLETFGAPEAVEPLIAMSRDPRTDVARAALVALGTLRDERAVPALVAELLSPQSPQTEVAASDALVTIASPSAIAPLRPLLLADPERIGPYLVAVGPPAWPMIRDVARPTTGAPAEALVRVWLRTGDPAALAAVPLDDEGRPSLGMLQHSPTSQAFCTAVDAHPDAIVELGAETWVDWASEAGAWTCLQRVVAAADLSDELRVAFAEALADEAPDAAADILAGVGSSALVRWEAFGRSVAKAAEHPEGLALVEQLTFAADPRVVREAARALELETEGALPPTIADALSASELPAPLVALLPRVEGGTERLLAIVAGGEPARRATAIRTAAATCSVSDGALQAAARSGDYWVRRAAAGYAIRCRADVTADASDALTLHAAFHRDADETLAAVARDGAVDPYLRVAALAELSERGVAANVAADLTGVVSPTLRASAIALLVDVDPALAAARTAAARTRLERAAWASHVSDPDARARLLRREGDAAVIRVLDGAPHFAAPVDVFAVDARDGQPRRDEVVIALRAEGRIAVSRTDRDGRVVFDHPDIRAVLIVDEP